VLTEATVDEEVLHVPPVTELLKAVVAPGHMMSAPAMVPADAVELTVMVRVAVAVPQLPATVYDIVAVPVEPPVTTPDVLTEATDGAELLHTPPVIELLKAVVAPGHIMSVPVIVPADAVELTVIMRVALAVPQLPVTVYDIVVVPDATPVTTPDALTVATDAEEELHTPPPAVLARAVVDPAQTVAVPVMVPAEGAALTVIVCVAVAVPPLPETVYEIVAEPGAIPVTTPVELTEAIPVADELQTPPVTVLESAIEDPAQTTVPPDMVPADTAAAPTVTDVVPVAAQPPPPVAVTL
jgi:hypothetical protein